MRRAESCPAYCPDLTRPVPYPFQISYDVLVRPVLSAGPSDTSAVTVAVAVAVAVEVDAEAKSLPPADGARRFANAPPYTYPAAVALEKVGSRPSPVRAEEARPTPDERRCVAGLSRATPKTSRRSSLSAMTSAREGPSLCVSRRRRKMQNVRVSQRIGSEGATAIRVARAASSSAAVSGTGNPNCVCSYRRVADITGKKKKRCPLLETYPYAWGMMVCFTRDTKKDVKRGYVSRCRPLPHLAIRSSD